MILCTISFFFFFNDTATTEIYTLSLHDALPIFNWVCGGTRFTDVSCGFRAFNREAAYRLTLFGKFTYTQETFIDLFSKGMRITDRKSTRLNSSHANISYAVFCLKKKKNTAA